MQSGCGAQSILQRKLHACPPQVFTLQLARQTESAIKHDIKAVALGLREVSLSLALFGFAVCVACCMLVHAVTARLSALLLPYIVTNCAAMHALLVAWNAGGGHCRHVPAAGFEQACVSPSLHGLLLQTALVGLYLDA